MWWLTFLNGGVVIIEASSLIHARSLQLTGLAGLSILPKAISLIPRVRR